jgi:hypothetical protein
VWGNRPRAFELLLALAVAGLQPEREHFLLEESLMESPHPEDENVFARREQWWNDRGRLINAGTIEGIARNTRVRPVVLEDLDSPTVYEGK